VPLGLSSPPSVEPVPGFGSLIVANRTVHGAGTHRAWQAWSGEGELTASGARAPDAPCGCSPIPAGSLAVAPPDGALRIANKLSMPSPKRLVRRYGLEQVEVRSVSRREHGGDHADQPGEHHDDDELEGRHSEGA